MFNLRLILTLLNIDGLGRKTINKILKYELPRNLEATSILSFLDNCRIDTKRIPQVNIKHIIEAKNKCEEIIEKCKIENIKIITILDNTFPQKLRIIDDNPILIYYKGNLECINNNKSMAIIGTRTPTAYGEKIAYEYSKILSKKGFVIVSGLALGCDTFAHKGCLEIKGQTVAVMPCGVDIVYPKSNIRLYESILNNNGCIISEYAPNQHPYKNQFVERDRLESALSEGVIVVETSLNSGTMHTVNFAINQNKLLACHVPKEIYKYKDSVRGNLQLLKNKKTYPLHNLISLNEFVLEVEEKMKFINDNTPKEEYRQITFLI